MKRRVSLYIVVIILIFILVGCYRTEINFENNKIHTNVSDDENDSDYSEDANVYDIIEKLDITGDEIDVQLGTNITVNARITPYEKYSNGLGLYYAYSRGELDATEDELAANVNKLYGENIALTSSEASKVLIETGDILDPNVYVYDGFIIFDLSEPSLYYIQHDAYEYGGHWYDYIDEQDIYSDSIGNVETLFEGLVDISTYTNIDIIAINDEFYERAESIYATLDYGPNYLIDEELFNARTKFYMIKMTEEREGIPIDYILNFKSAVACNCIFYGLDENLELKAVESRGNTHVDTNPFETHNIVDAREILSSFYDKIMSLIIKPIVYVTEIELSYVPQYMDDGETVYIKPFWIIHTLERGNSSDIIYVYDAATGELIKESMEGRI
ncbi:MAG: hypothetical protein E7266_09990 [Lachnospiraceae bacterium]|nr:hypothetical protein [Lachnospiraceae bacterium]